MSAIDLNARASASYAQNLAETQALLRQAALDYAPLSVGAAPRITLACSLGAEDMVLAHLINSLQLDIGIFVLETGQLHAETLALLNRLQATSRAPVQVFKPVQEVAIQFVEREGKDAWITGLRREKSGARADVPLVYRSDAAKVKFNPLGRWTWGDVWFYIAENKVDYNPLHDQFYPSIGCAPCTRAISLGEDFRAGRWWWEDETAKECGLHVKASPLPEKHA
jgi:phosphoadenosine phosphosulfate reductase